jgi:hypothetical protein
VAFGHGEKADPNLDLGQRSLEETIVKKPCPLFTEKLLSKRNLASTYICVHLQVYTCIYP